MTLRKRIAAADQDLLNRLLATERPGLDEVMHRLGRVADHGALWIAVAAGLGAKRDKWTRRAALRGVASLAIGSTAANVLAKQMVGRSRPPGPAVPGRRPFKPLRTTSFPSGHAASAAAFATGVALETPGLAVPVGALAAAVGASRVITRAHYPSDVAAGFALGTAAGLLTLRWWPRRPTTPAAAARPRREAPAAPDGAGLVLIVNCGAGTASEDLADSLSKSLPAAEIVTASPEDDLDGMFADAAGRAVILGVAGGDGSVRLAAGIASEKGLPLLVVPAGTFNHFAADLGVRSCDDALAALKQGDSVLVDVATADGAAFVNTASTGVYVDLVEAREHLEPSLGKWPAVLIALIGVLRHSKPADLLVNGRRRRVWLLFAGNCRYEPSGAAPAYRPDLADGTLDVRLVDGTQPLARTRLIAAVLLGTLGRSRVYRMWSATDLRVASANGDPVPLCLDGEATQARSEVGLTKRPKKLLVYRPAAGE
jgi:diacylglycerol kinase family enzyme/membrane-associated phospholipid phosphatase